MAKNKTLREEELDRAFANKLRESHEFLLWVLGHTGFSKYKNVRLMHEEQLQARRSKEWWRHWWCGVPNLDRQSETDIFIVCEVPETRKRFAVHFENKIANGSFTTDQAQSYDERAKYMMHKMHREKFGYTDYETVLISPESFREKYRRDADLFHRFISHEDIAEFVPEFTVR
jgi:hypothetical protein